MPLTTRTTPLGRMWFGHCSICGRPTGSSNVKANAEQRLAAHRCGDDPVALSTDQANAEIALRQRIQIATDEARRDVAAERAAR